MSGSSPLLERVARAICEQAFYERQGHSPDPHDIDRHWIRFADQAQAAIEVVNGDDAAIEARKAARVAWDGFFFLANRRGA